MIYELIWEKPHNHLVCDQCGAVIEIGDLLQDSLHQILEKHYSFFARAQHFVIYGQCVGCRNQGHPSLTPTLP
jgi:Fur family ferric uptake transcriptional regulator